MADYVAFREQKQDEASEAFRIAAEDDRPLRVLCPLTDHAVYRQAGRVARSAARRAAQVAGIDVPELRWFHELQEQTKPSVCSGLVIRIYPNIVWLNRSRALDKPPVLEWIVAHEIGHLAGYLSEEDANDFADRVVGQRADAGCVRVDKEAKWFPTGAPVDVNTWDLRHDGSW